MTSIVVGIDGSDDSRRALRWALDEARLRHTTLRVVHAWRMPYAPAIAGYVPLPEAPLYDAAKKGAQHVLDEELSAIEAADVKVEPLLVEGSLVPMLLQAGKDADLLVVGSRGHGGFAELLLGSTGQQVAHHATCPVVIVR
jgi:nucleotide-binding universal stress UspA family protein